jgi:phosphotransferase system  glucose/maltose/N-acetylglucosamine-specific IIC component
MSEERPSLGQVLDKNLSFLMAILGVPVIGMLIAVVVIYIKKPNNMVVVFGVILFVAVQYIMMMFFFMKKVEAMVENEKAERDLESQEKPEPDEGEGEESADQLDPEEKRIFPLKADEE